MQKIKHDFLSSEEKDLKISQLQSENDKLNIELAYLKLKLEEKENMQESLEKTTLYNRCIVRAEHPNHSNGIMWDINSLAFHNLANFKLIARWKTFNEDLTSESYMKWMPRQFALSFTYRFRQGEKVEVPRRKKDINSNAGGDDDMPPM